MKKRSLRIIGALSLLAGLIFLLNSFSGITGFVIMQQVSRNVSGILGLVFILVGLVLMLARPPLDYNKIATMIYDTLGGRNAYGHHTEKIDDVKRWVSGGNITPEQVDKVLREEVRSGRLSLDKTRTSISIPRKRDKLEEILDNFGSSMRSDVRDRLEQLKRGRTPPGVR